MIEITKPEAETRGTQLGLTHQREQEIELLVHLKFFTGILENKTRIEVAVDAANVAESPTELFIAMLDFNSALQAIEKMPITGLEEHIKMAKKFVEITNERLEQLKNT